MIRGRKLGPEIYRDAPHDRLRLQATVERAVMEKGLTVSPWLDLLVAVVELARKDAEDRPKALNGQKPDVVQQDARAFLQWARETIQ